MYHKTNQCLENSVAVLVKNKKANMPKIEQVHPRTKALISENILASRQLLYTLNFGNHQALKMKPRTIMVK